MTSAVHIAWRNDRVSLHVTCYTSVNCSFLQQRSINIACMEVGTVSLRKNRFHSVAELWNFCSHVLSLLGIFAPTADITWFRSPTQTMII